MKFHLFFRFSKSPFLFFACALAGFGVPQCAIAQRADIAVVSSPFMANSLFKEIFGANFSTIRTTLMTGLVQGRVKGIPLADAGAMQAFYALHDNRLVWVDPLGNGQARVRAILRVLDDSWTQALNPADYHVKDIHILLQQNTPAAKARLELLVSDAMIRYGHDMTGMRLPPAATGEDPQFWRKPVDAQAVLKAVAISGDPVAALESFAPHDGLYARLRQALIALTHQERPKFHTVALSVPILHPGDVDSGVPELRTRLGQVYNPDRGPENKYDDSLAGAVMTFQRKNNLAPDGDIGPKTLALLNRSPQAKIDQIAVNMERLRWLPEQRPDRYILVNIPSQTLWAVDHDRVALQMPVIVGRPERPTNSFIAKISGVRFNPDWTVPATIKANDMLAHLQADPAYLESKGIELSAIIDGHRETLDPASIDWASVTKPEIMRMRMVQAPGDNNALGRVRVLMPNPYDIYLHDTSAPVLFNREKRALSSGCVRMANPEAVARFILAGKKGWSAQKMDDVIASSKMTDVAAPERMPVYIVYQTIWLDRAGRLVYGPDIYGRDKTLLKAMQEADTFPAPVPGKAEFANLAPVADVAY